MSSVNKFQKQRENIAYFETFEVINKEIYAFLWWKNILIKINPDSNETEFLMLHNTYFFKHCISDGKKIYFADNLGKVLVTYDLDLKLREEYSLDSGVKEDNNIVTVEDYGEHVFIIENYRGNIYIYNKKNKYIETDLSLAQAIKQRSEKETETTYVYCWKIESSLFFRVVHENSYEIFKYNLENRCLEEVHGVSLPQQWSSDAYYFEGRLFMLQDDFHMIVWDIRNNTVDNIEMTDLYQLPEDNKTGCAFSSIAVTKKNVWLLPSAQGKDIYIYDIAEKSVRRYDDYPPDFFYLDTENWSKYSDIKERQGFIYAAARTANYYLVINAESGTGIWKPAYVNNFSTYYSHYMKEIKSQKEKNIVEQCIPLKCYLSYMQKQVQEEADKKNFGTEIWREIK